MELRGHILWRSAAGTAWVPGTLEVRAGRVFWQNQPVTSVASTVRIARGAQQLPGQILTGWIVPGLVDAHCHLGIDENGPQPDQASIRAQAKANRDVGVLAIRDCGVPVDNSFLQAEPNMPRLIRCGQHFARPRRYLRYYGKELVDQAELPAALLRQVEHSDGWVKIIADWIDRDRGVEAGLDPLWDPGVLAEAVAAVHRAGGRVTAHCFGHQAVAGLLAADVDGIEHGTGMDATQIAEAAARGIAVTPTMLQSELFGAFTQAGAAKFPRYAAEMRHLHEHRLD